MINRRPYVLITAVSLSLLTALILIALIRASGDGEPVRTRCHDDQDHVAS
jgi:hypothetical protein